MTLLLFLKELKSYSMLVSLKQQPFKDILIKQIKFLQQKFIDSLNQLKFTPIKQKPLLNEVAIQNRLKFSKTHLAKKTDWDMMIFADECSFQTYSYPKKAWLTKENPIYKIKPKFPAKIHAWGGISSRGTTVIFLFTENLNSELYADIIEDVLIPSAERLYPEGDWVLVHDNDPKHRSGLVQDFLNEEDIQQCENWPSYYPDLNPIENIWADLKRELEKDNIINLKQLKMRIQQLWNQLTKQKLNPYIQSMRNRLLECKKNKGQHTAY